MLYKGYVLVALKQPCEIERWSLTELGNLFCVAQQKSGSINQKARQSDSRDNAFDHYATDVSLHLMTWNIFLIYLVIPIIQDTNEKSELNSHIFKYYQ